MPLFWKIPAPYLPHKWGILDNGALWEPCIKIFSSSMPTLISYIKLFCYYYFGVVWDSYFQLPVKNLIHLRQRTLQQADPSEIPQRTKFCSITTFWEFYCFYYILGFLLFFLKKVSQIEKMWLLLIFLLKLIYLWPLYFETPNLPK